MFQHILYTQLCTVTHSPHTVELKTVGHAIFLDKHSCGTTTRDKIHTLGVKLRDRRVETSAIIGVEETRAVGSNQRTAHSIDAVDDMLLNSGTLGILLRETGTHNDKTLRTLLLRQHIDSLCAELGCNTQYGAIHLRQILDLGKTFNALNLGLLGVDCIDRTAEITLKEILQGLASGFVYIARCTADNNAAGI